MGLFDNIGLGAIGGAGAGVADAFWGNDLPAGGFGGNFGIGGMDAALGGIFGGAMGGANAFDPFAGAFNGGAGFNPLAGGGLQQAIQQQALRQRMQLGSGATRAGGSAQFGYGGSPGSGYGYGGGSYAPGARGGYDMMLNNPYGNADNGGYISGGSPYVNAGGGGGGAGGSAMAQTLLKEFQSAHNSAKKANEQRYGDILAGYQNRYQRGMDLLNRTSGQERRDINSQYDRASADTTQSATDRGLGNTTILDSLQRGVGEDRSKALNRQSDQDAQRKLTADMQLDQDTLAFKERRTDAYPSYELMASLASQAGQGGGGGGYGGGGAGGAGGGGGGGGGYGGGTNTTDKFLIQANGLASPNPNFGGNPNNPRFLIQANGLAATNANYVQPNKSAMITANAGNAVRGAGAAARRAQWARAGTLEQNMAPGALAKLPSAVQAQLRALAPK